MRIYVDSCIQTPGVTGNSHRVIISLLKKMGSFLGKLTSSTGGGGNYFESRSFKERDLKTADVLFVDMRDKEEFEELHIRTALHLPLPQVGTNKTQLERIFNESGIQELLYHFHTREDPLTLILYSSRPSNLLQDISRLLYYHKEFFSSFSHQLYILAGYFYFLLFLFIFFRSNN